MTARSAPQSAKSWKRLFRAQLLYLWILVREFVWTWAAFALIVVFGGLCVYTLPQDPGMKLDHRPDFIESMYYTFSMMFMEHLTPFPQQMVLRVWYFAVPLVSFMVFSEALVRFGVLLFSKENSSDRWVKAVVKTYNNHVILCGMGRLGVRVLQELMKMGDEVVVIEKDANAFGVQEARKWKVPVIIDNARNEDVMKELGIDRAKCVIAATNDDMANLEIALDAKQLNPNIRVVMRFWDYVLGQKIANNFDIKMVFSTTALAAPSFAAASGGGRNLVQSFYVDDKLVQTVRITVGDNSALIGKELRSLWDKFPLAVISHRPKGGSAKLFPPSETKLSAGDEIKIQAEASTISQLQKANGE